MKTEIEPNIKTLTYNLHSIKKNKAREKLLKLKVTVFHGINMYSYL